MRGPEAVAVVLPNRERQASFRLLYNTCCNHYIVVVVAAAAAPRGAGCDWVFVVDVFQLLPRRGP